MKFFILFLLLCQDLSVFSEDDILPVESQVHHRVRRLALSKNSKVSFDVELMLPIPSLGGVDVSAILEFPLTITMLNDTYVYNPITVPYVIQPVAPVQYPSYMPNHYSYDTYYGESKPNPYPYHLMKRSLAAASAIDRSDLFTAISDVLENYGIDGRECIYKQICQLAHAPLLIESPLHETLEHILTISRAYDEEGLLEEYAEAEKFGRSKGNCSEKYACSFSLFTDANFDG